MITKKFEFEQAFEQALARYEIPFSDRVYREELRQAAQIDDVLGKTSVGDVEEIVQEADIATRTLMGIFEDDVLSDYQLDEFHDTTPLFRRVATIGDYHINYVVNNTHIGDDEKSSLDLINAGLAVEETVNLSHDGKLFFDFWKEKGNIHISDKDLSHFFIPTLFDSVFPYHGKPMSECQGMIDELVEALAMYRRG